MPDTPRSIDKPAAGYVRIILGAQKDDGTAHHVTCDIPDDEWICFTERQMVEQILIPAYAHLKTRI